MWRAVDACTLWKKGELQPILETAGLLTTTDNAGNPFEFLPKWMAANPLGDK